MISIFQEVSVPKLTQTSLYVRFNETNDLTKTVISAINGMKDYIVTPDKIPEIISLIKLNGDPIAKKAIKYIEDGKIVIINNKETSQIPSSLPYITITKDGVMRGYIFADKVVDNIQSSTEYTRLMAVIEATYLALKLQEKPETFILNRALVLTFCNLYVDMVTAPLEQKLYIKGENLTKLCLYTMAYFYRIIDGDAYDPKSMPNIAKRVILDKVDPIIIKQIADEVGSMEDVGFMSLIELFKKINPVRYKDLDTIYMSHFIATDGMPLIFALENLQYLFLLMTSSAYKTSLTGYGLNKEVSPITKKAIKLLTTLNI